MELSTKELKLYMRDGYLLKPGCFSAAEIQIMREEVKTLAGKNTPERIMETNGLVRSLYGVHSTSDIFRQLVRHPHVLRPSMQLLASEVYVYQFKINIKAAVGGDVWGWHQDFIFWNKEDGLREPRIVNACIFLNDVTEFNGPMMVIPASHKLGMIDIESHASEDSGGDKPQWLNHLSADLKYSPRREMVASLVATYGIAAPKGPAGSILLFDSNLFHGSPSNISPFDRTMILVTYNSINNPPVPIGKRRPEFLAARDILPLDMLADDCIIKAAP